MDIHFLAQADAATLQLEKAKRALEAAKLELETAKRNYEELLARSEEFGIPKAKLKKITEDRIQALFESGLIGFLDTPSTTKEMKEPKLKKPTKQAKTSKASEVETANEPTAEMTNSANVNTDALAPEPAETIEL